jgi:IS30 family transposase
MENYTQLTSKERRQIYSFLDMGMSKTDIARRLGRNKSTIYREIKRNKEENSYFPGIAQQKADIRKQKERCCKLQKVPALYEYILRHLKTGWSPEQISGRMRLENKSYYVCHETIYRYIYRQRSNDLYQHLHYKKMRRGIRFGRKSRACRYGDIRLIDKRPNEIATRETFGHWEGDSVVFSQTRKQSIATLVERKSRAVAIIKNQDIKSTTVMNNIKSRFVTLPKKAAITITFDQGSEFAYYRIIEMETDCRVFYCRVRSPWEKGGNENMNGRIRRYLPLNTDIESVEQEQLDRLAQKLNNTPRKCLGYETPREVYLKHCKNYNGLQL